MTVSLEKFDNRFVETMADYRDRQLNMHALTVRFAGPTNYRGSRVTITDERHNSYTDEANGKRRTRVTLPYDYRIGSTLEQALAWLVRAGYDIVGTAESTDHYIVLSRNFMSLSQVNREVAG